MATRVLIAAVLSTASPAFADGAFVEGDIGVAIPLSDEDYENSVDGSVKLGLRIGTATKFGAIDFGVDFTPFNDELTNLVVADVDIQRYRFLLGVRYHHPVTPKVRIFARVGAGLDLIHYSAKGNFIVPFEFSETDLGFALDFSGGVLFDVGKVQIGAKLGVPMAFHFEEDDPNNNEDADLDYTSIDLDLSFVMAFRF